MASSAAPLATLTCSTTVHTLIIVSVLDRSQLDHSDQRSHANSLVPLHCISLALNSTVVLLLILCYNLNIKCHSSYYLFLKF